MKRKDYERPATKVVLLQHMGMLMTSDPNPNQRKKRATMDIEYDEEDI
jgi:hypothetical protein